MKTLPLLLKKTALKTVLRIFLILFLFIHPFMLFSQWTLENELDCDFTLKIDCDDGSSQTVTVNSTSGYGYWGSPTNIPMNSVSCPCTNPTFSITTSNSGYGNGNQSFDLVYYLSIVGGTGTVDPNDISDPNNPFIYCCCYPCSSSSLNYPCISNGCAAIVIDPINCKVKLKKPSPNPPGCP